MNILSLFDGISCCQQALKELKIPCIYYASEIDKYCISITQHNFPETIQLGDVKNVGIHSLPSGTQVDLLIGGSPCQDLSISKKNREGLSGSRSNLFYEYVRILKELKPTYFVLENVASMPKEAKATITEIMGVEAIMINASLVSAQQRKRLFWTNIPNITQPEDQHIYLKHILQPPSEVEDKYIISKQRTSSIKKSGIGKTRDVEGKTTAITASYYKTPNDGNYIPIACSLRGRYIENGKRKDVLGAKTTQRLEVGGEKAHTITSVCKDSLVKLGHIGNSDAQGNRVYSIDGKTPTLSSNGGGLGAKMGLYDTTDSRPEIGQANRVYGGEGKTPPLQDWSPKVNDTITIRRLTPIECERLQSLPDNYTKEPKISDTQRYKALGNSFNCAVIKGIIKCLIF